MVVTADALHTVKASAEIICDQVGDYVPPVKENRDALARRLDALPWQDIPVADRSMQTGHGRTTTRTIQVQPAPPDLGFPHTVWLVERYVTTSHNTSAVAQLGITSLTAEQANPADLARYNRDHWHIEMLHWHRDTIYQEDKSTIRTGSRPQAIATLRNLAIIAIRLARRTDITEVTRWATRDMTRPFRLLGLMP